MTEANIRLERINRLFKELEYEITRGFFEKEISEHLEFRFIVGVSRETKGGVVKAEFDMRPTPAHHLPSDFVENLSKLRVVK